MQMHARTNAWAHARTGAGTHGRTDARTQGGAWAEGQRSGWSECLGDRAEGQRSLQNYKPQGTQIVTRNLQNGAPKPPKWSPEPSKIEPKWGQEGARRTKKSKNNIDLTKKRVELN